MRKIILLTLIAGGIAWGQNSGVIPGPSSGGSDTGCVPGAASAGQVITSNGSSGCTPNAGVTVSGSYTGGKTVLPLGAVDARQYGADPTGVADSSPAVRAAAAALGSSAGMLYFPTGTYLFNSFVSSNEECVRLTSSISLLGDGPGKTIFNGDSGATCGALFGWFYNSTTDYSWEADTGYATNAASAPIGSPTVTITTASNATLFAVGQYVYLRGTSEGSGIYHGMVNMVSVAGNGSTGVVGLKWPLSSDFTQDSGLQLNIVASSEVLSNVQISGITWNHYDSAALGAQIIGLKLTNNVFNYLGSSTGYDTFQWNQDHQVEISGNTFSNLNGAPIDASRNPTEWDVHDNVIRGAVDFVEYGANANLHNNTITCGVAVPSCIYMNISGANIDGNIVNYAYTGGSGVGGIVDYNGGSAFSYNVTISNNIVSAYTTNAYPAIVLDSPGSVATGNTVTTNATGLVMNFNGESQAAYNNSVTITASGNPYGCVLIEGSTSHAAIINGLHCANASGITGYATVFISDNGAQTAATQAQLSNIVSDTTTHGLYISNSSHDSPMVLNSPTLTLNVAFPGNVTVENTVLMPPVAVTDGSPIAWSATGVGTVTLNHSTGTRALNLTGLATGGFYTLIIKQDSTGGAAMTLGTGCTWKVGGGGSGAISLTSTALATDILAFFYDGTNCYANFQTNFN